MPIYEYQCNACGNTFEVFFSSHKKSTKADCPKCKGTTTKKMSVNSFQLKGSGWAKDNYQK